MSIFLPKYPTYDAGPSVEKYARENVDIMVPSGSSSFESEPYDNATRRYIRSKRRDLETQMSGDSTLVASLKSTLVEPWYRDPRNLLLPNIAHAWGTNVRNRPDWYTNLATSLAVAVGLYAYDKDMFYAYGTFQCGFQILDYVLEMFPFTDDYHSLLVGNYLQESYLKEGKKPT
jgi:hypothetical protein